jgi:hypothetical protein
MAGEGNAGANGGDFGDLYVAFRVHETEPI